MTVFVRIAALFLAIGLAITRPGEVAAFNDTTVTAAPGGVAAGGDIRGNTINFGLTSEQLKQATEATVSGALLDRITTISMKLGVTEGAAKTLLRIVHEQDIPDERLAEELTKVASEYKRLQAKVAVLNPHNPVARNLATQARNEIDVGHLARAHELLRQATQAQIAAAQEARNLREQAQAAEDAQMLGAAESTAAEGNVAFTERHYAQAADLFSQAVEYTPPGHPDERRSFLGRLADALLGLGVERGDNDALRKSIEIYRLNLGGLMRDRAPFIWAVEQFRLGTALLTLGSRENETAHLQEATKAYRAALEEMTRDREPLAWAQMQSHLGVTLSTLGQRESGTARLKEAVTAFRNAQKEYTRDRTPLEWAAVQTGLATALAMQGWHEVGTDHLIEGIVAHRAALEERTRDRVPLQWAETLHYLGLALWALGEREDGTVSLEEAVVAFRGALEERTRARVQLNWAYSQHGLALALATLGKRLKAPGQMKEALDCMRGAVAAYQQVGEGYWRPIAEKDVTRLETQLAEMKP